MKVKVKVLIITVIFLMIFNISYGVFAMDYKKINLNLNRVNKIENGNMLQEFPTSNSSDQIFRYNLKYQGTEINDKTELSETFVNRDGYNYTYSRKNWSNYVEIKRYCFETGEYKTVYESADSFDVETVCGYYVLDKIIYIALYSTTESNQLRIVGYDTQTETLIYNKTFPISSEQYKNNFCVDDKQNMYFVLKGKSAEEATIATYDKNGNAIDSITKPFFDGYYGEIYLTGVDKNSRVLFLSLQTSSGFWWDDCIIRIDNGTFIKDKEVFLMREYAGTIWTFLNDAQTYAYNQYGEFFEINYNADNEAGIEYIYKNEITIDGTYPYIGYLYSSDDKYLYLGTEQGYLYIYNWNTYKIEKSLFIGENKAIVGVYKADNDKILIEYYNQINQKIYALILNLSDYEIPQKNIEINDHTALAHTKDQIKNKYNELKIINTTTDLYEIEPSIRSPYLSGSLKEQVKIDTLNQIKYFRWIAGLENIITINNEYMESSQKGAVLLAANALVSGNPNYLTHYPGQPSDMADDFFSVGYAATSAGFGTSANVSFGTLMAESVRDYIDDTTNLEPNVGHRLSILDSQAVSTSFGFAGKHGVINIFSDYSVINEDNYYSWPSPGYFPIESIDPNAMWSVSIPNSCEYNVLDYFNVVIKANGKEYSSNDCDFELYYEQYYNACYFEIPKELKEYLVEGTNVIKDGKTVEVEFYGLADNLGNEYVIKYPINFFSLNEKDSLIGDVNKDGKITLADYTKILAHVKKTQLLTGDALKAADVNKDGKVTLADYTKVLAHVKKTASLF